MNLRLLLSILLAWLVGCAGGDADPESAGAERTIAVIPKGTTHVFWKSVERGARRAGQERGVRIVWKGPLKENDSAQQIQLVQNFVTQDVAGIVLAPLDFKALVAPVQAAMARGIPVTIIDSALEGEAGTDFVSFVATDNETGGRLGGEHLGSLLGGEGKVVLLRYQAGSASTTHREQGFLKAIARQAGLEVLSENRFAGPTAGEAKTAALNMVDSLRAASGVFCPNESSTLGMLLALRAEGLAGKIRFVGFDASPPLVEGLRAGDIDALVVQNPDRMGYEGVTQLLRHLDGEAVPAVVDTGVVVVTQANVDSPEIQELVQ